MNKIAKNTTLLILTTLLGRASGFLRELVLARQFGASGVSDAFVVAYTMPFVLLMGFASAIATIYIPMFLRVNSQSEADGKHLSNNLVTILCLLGITVSALFMLYPHSIVRLFAVGFDARTLELTVMLARFMMWSITPILLTNLFSAYLQLQGSFFICGSYTLLVNACIIASLLNAAPGSLSVLGFGVLGGYIAACILFIAVSYKKGFRYAPVLDFKSDETKTFLALFLPVFLNGAIQQINNLIDRSFASTLAEGTVSALNYSSKCQEFITAVFVASMITVLFPQLSRLHNIGDHQKIKEYLAQGLSVIALFILPVTVGLIVLARPVITLLFARGSFNEQAVKITFECLMFYSVGLIGFNINPLLSKVFYALEDSKTPTVNSTIAVGINILLNIILIKNMQHRGLALATSIASIVATILLLVSLNKKLGSLNLRGTLIDITKMGISSLIMGGIVFAVNRALFYMCGNSFHWVGVNVVLSITLGLAVYVPLLLLLRVRQARDIVDIAKSKLNLLRFSRQARLKS